MIVFKKFKKSKNLKQLNSLHQYSLKESKLKKICDRQLAFAAY